ncbi:Hypothetical predicted protein [Olea europaea subsp. europaea]|uniref:Uncharacterized protein n=1 Tax=Olea europaea subsp. europaea TaxID=158383 RepID=A0A8S0SGA6_OLEEU|nr:Hypothetical predicted protein [Olea europaea subsp. europaea]
MLTYDVAREWESTGTSVVTVESLVSVAEEGERHQGILGLKFLVGTPSTRCYSRQSRVGAIGLLQKLFPNIGRLFSHHRTTNVTDIAVVGEQVVLAVSSSGGVVSTASSSGRVVSATSSSGGVQTERLFLFDFAEDREMRVGLAC